MRGLAFLCISGERSPDVAVTGLAGGPDEEVRPRRGRGEILELERARVGFGGSPGRGARRKPRKSGTAPMASGDSTAARRRSHAPQRRVARGYLASRGGFDRSARAAGTFRFLRRPGLQKRLADDVADEAPEGGDPVGG